jgi:hypothetical protein
MCNNVFLHSFSCKCTKLQMINKNVILKILTMIDFASFYEKIRIRKIMFLTIYVKVRTEGISELLTI